MQFEKIVQQSAQEDGQACGLPRLSLNDYRSNKMKASELAHQFQKRKENCGLDFILGAPVENELIEKIERILNIKFPEQVRYFYQANNGLKVDSPKLEILPIQKLEKNKNTIPFATVDGGQQICFDTSFD